MNIKKILIIVGIVFLVCAFALSSVNAASSTKTVKIKSNDLKSYVYVKDKNGIIMDREKTVKSMYIYVKDYNYDYKDGDGIYKGSYIKIYQGEKVKPLKVTAKFNRTNANGKNTTVIKTATISLKTYNGEFNGVLDIYIDNGTFDSATIYYKIVKVVKITKYKSYTFSQSKNKADYSTTKLLRGNIFNGKFKVKGERYWKSFAYSYSSGTYNYNILKGRFNSKTYHTIDVWGLYGSVNPTITITYRKFNSNGNPTSTKDKKVFKISKYGLTYKSKLNWVPEKVVIKYKIKQIKYVYK
ncbi:MAG: hypothetical protein ACRCVG_00795 [Methanobacteriaceae archaeon]